MCVECPRDYSTYVTLPIQCLGSTMPLGRPRGRPRKQPSLPLASASERLAMLEKAGYNSDRIGVVLAKSLAVAESIIDDPEVDPFAKLAAIKLIVRDIAAVAPMKASGPQHAVQAPVIINIGDLPPAPSREPRAVGRGSTAPQPGITIDAKPNPD